MRIDVRTSRREEFVDITAQIREFAEKSGATEGAVLVFCPHTTAAVTINENADPSVQHDLADGLDQIAPREGNWRHAEGNSDGHIKSSLVGPSLLVPIEAGRLVLGTWQGVYFCEFDGPRNRWVNLNILSGG